MAVSRTTRAWLARHLTPRQRRWLEFKLYRMPYYVADAKAAVAITGALTLIAVTIRVLTQ